MEMVIALRKMLSCWIDDEIEIIFKELIRGKRIKTFPPPHKMLSHVYGIQNPVIRHYLFGWMKNDN